MAIRAVLRIVAVLSLVAVLLVMASPASGQSTVTAVVRAKGQTGAEQMRVYTGTDEILYEATLTTEWEDHLVRVPTSATLLYVGFVNDGRTSSGADKNMLVDRVVWDGGTVVQAEDVLSRGVWNGTDCGEGNRNSELLACNGWFRFDAPGDGGDGNDVTFSAQGTTGKEVVELEINGEVITSFELTTSIKTYGVSYSSDVNQVRINFINDRVDEDGDRNVMVEYAETAAGRIDAIEVESKGVWNGTDCGIGFRQSRLLACNGWFQFIFDDGGNNNENGDVEFEILGTTGTEKVEVYVNDRLWGGIDPFPTPIEIGMPLPDGDIYSIRVVFVNDGRDGEGRDRNVRLLRISALGVDYGPADYLGKGVWDGTSCDREAYHNTDFLACNGWFEIDPDIDDRPVDIRGFSSYGCKFQTGPEVNGVADQLAWYNWFDHSTGETDYIAYTHLERPDSVGDTYHLGANARSVGIATDTDTLERVKTVDITGPAGELVTVELGGGCPTDRSWNGDVTILASQADDGSVDVVWNIPNVPAGDPDYVVTLTDSNGQPVASRQAPTINDPDLGLIGRTNFDGTLAAERQYQIEIETCIAYHNNGDPCSEANRVLLHEPYNFYVLGVPGNGNNRPAPAAVIGSVDDDAGFAHFNVVWDDANAGTAADSYEIVVERKSHPGDVVGWTSTAGDATIANVKVRAFSDEYRFSVRGCGNDGCSVWSEWSDWVALGVFG